MVKKYGIVHTNCFGISPNFSKMYKMQYTLYLKSLLHWHFAACKPRVRFWVLTKSQNCKTLIDFIYFLFKILMQFAFLVVPTA